MNRSECQIPKSQHPLSSSSWSILTLPRYTLQFAGWLAFYSNASGCLGLTTRSPLEDLHITSPPGSQICPSVPQAACRVSPNPHGPLATNFSQSPHVSYKVTPARYHSVLCCPLVHLPQEDPRPKLGPRWMQPLAPCAWTSQLSLLMIRPMSAAPTLPGPGSLLPLVEPVLPRPQHAHFGAHPSTNKRLPSQKALLIMSHAKHRNSE